ncbi:DUF5634 family protein [Desertibacillus haloalkaliphilus]|nr:DUF5634 family protein [Desertibacillus haloalkaliphilus]
MNRMLEPLMEKYDLDDIGVYEEEGEAERYYIGYTVKKDGEVYMVNMPFEKDHEGKLALKEGVWTIQADDNDDFETHGYYSLDDVFESIENGIEH